MSILLPDSVRDDGLGHGSFVLLVRSRPFDVSVRVGNLSSGHQCLIALNILKCHLLSQNNIIKCDLLHLK